MIPALQYIPAEIVNAGLPRGGAIKGVVERKVDKNTYIIASSSGQITIKVTSGRLSEGDAVALLAHGKEVLVEKIPARPSAASIPSSDTVDVRNEADAAGLKLLADAAAEQLTKRIVDKDTLAVLQRIIATVAKNPGRFGDDTVAAVAELKSFVSTMPAGGADVSKTAGDIADKIIALGEKLAQKLISDGGATDIVLRSDARTQEGYFRFDNVKSAVSWLAQAKELNENIPWQKLAQTFKDGPVVVKVYESALGDLRASFVAPDKTEDELSHFTASSLRANVWKDISQTVLQNVLRDSREIPVQRLLEIDELLVEGEKQNAAGQPPAALASKGRDAAMSQWLSMALEDRAPLPQLVARVPLAGAGQIPQLLSEMDAYRRDIEVSNVNTLRADEYSLCPPAAGPQPALPDLFNRLGLNLESVLLKSDDSAPAEMQPQNLKASLLTLLAALDSSSARRPAPDPSAATVESAHGSATPSPPRDAPEAADAVQTARLTVAEIREKLTQTLSSLSDAALSVSRSAADSAPLETRQSTDSVKALKDTAADLEKLAAALSKTALESAQRLAALAVRHGTVADDTADEIIATVKDLAGRIQDMGRRLVQIENQLDKDLGFQSSDPAKRSDSGQTGLREVFKEFSASARSVSDQAATASRDLAKRLEDLTAQVDKLSQDAPAAASRRDQLDVLRQQVETALTRVESLQVLARCLSVADGTQQVISLPMKIEGQWTDVVVKFKKKKGRSGTDEAARPISVAVHVSPTMLGTIDVFMDYDPTKRCSMRMEFEKQTTRAWFVKNRTGFADAVSALGFSVLKIDMKEIAPERPNGMRQMSPASSGAESGIIDITA